jgi:hypothetical protein
MLSSIALLIHLVNLFEGLSLASGNSPTISLTGEKGEITRLKSNGGPDGYAVRKACVILRSWLYFEKGL